MIYLPLILTTTPNLLTYNNTKLTTNTYNNTNNKNYVWLLTTNSLVLTILESITAFAINLPRNLNLVLSLVMCADFMFLGTGIG